MSCFSDNLTYLKERAGLSSSALGRKLGMPTSSISRLLNPSTQPRRTSIALISSRLGLEPHVLEKEPYSYNPLLFDEAIEVLKQLPDAGTVSISIEKAGIQIIRPSEKDFRITAEDLFDYEKLRNRYAAAQIYAKKDPDFIGFLALRMPTDELAPTVPRGSVALLAAEEDKHNPSSSSDFAVGIIEDKKIFTFGILEIAQGKMFISPINPRFKGASAEVSSVVARVRGWLVITKN